MPGKKKEVKKREMGKKKYEENNKISKALSSLHP
jgi:hypothetical protein